VSVISADQELRKQGGEQEFEDVNWVQAPPRGVPYYDNGILNFVFGDMWKRPGLTRRDRRWILACVGLDDTVGPIQSHVYSAMKSGDISFDEMREMVLQFAAHSGWPKGSFMQATVDAMHQRILDEI
jgi:4-carboxymuconolactone decarboxylase